MYSRRVCVVVGCAVYYRLTASQASAILSCRHPSQPQLLFLRNGVWCGFIWFLAMAAEPQAADQFPFPQFGSEVLVSLFIALWRLQQCLTPETTVTATEGATPGYWLLLKENHSGRQHWLQFRGCHFR